jgi:hypothetical protein
LCSTRIRKALLEKKEMTESGFICFMMVHYFLWTYPKRYKTHSLITSGFTVSLNLGAFG